jgi:hypothetical protein
MALLKSIAGKGLAAIADKENKKKLKATMILFMPHYDIR